jgi:fatty acid desaturase
VFPQNQADKHEATNIPGAFLTPQRVVRPQNCSWNLFVRLLYRRKNLSAAELQRLPMIELSPMPVADPSAELAPIQAVKERPTAGMRFATVLVIVIPFLGLLAAPFFLWGWGFTWVDLGLLLGMYVLTALGITVGFHRLFTHRAFETYSAVKFVLVILGSMAFQGPMLKWVAMHRRHHQLGDVSDVDGNAETVF